MIKANDFKGSLIHFMLALAISLVGAIIFNANSQEASAATVSGTFPRGEWVLLSKYQCPGHCLETPEAKFRIFYDTESSAYRNNNNFTATIEVICRGGNARPGGGMKLGPNNRRDWRSCDTSRVYTSPNYSISQTVSKGDLKQNNAKYTSRYKFVDLSAKVGGSSADIIAIVVNANRGGKVTFQESDPYTNYPSSNNYSGHGSGERRGPYSIGTAFAVFENRGGEYARDFNLHFKTDCSVSRNESVFLRWYDADKNTGTNPHDLKFDLYDQTAGSYVVRNHENLGGNDSYRDYRFNIKPGHKYKWTWKNVTNYNGIQIWMPFSEFNADIRCDEPPEGNLRLSCSNNGIRVRDVRDKDDNNNNARINIDVNGSSFKRNHWMKGDHNFNWPSGAPRESNNRVTLTIKNVTPEGNVNSKGERVITKRIDCPRSDPGCKDFKWTLQPNSRYRFTIFSTSSTNHNFVSNSPPNGREVNNSTFNGWNNNDMPRWKAFNSGPQKQTLTTNGSNNRSETSISFPAPRGSGYVIYVERWHHFDSNNNGSLDRWKYYEARRAENNCFAATCVDSKTSVIIPPNSQIPGRPAGIKEGHPFSALVTIKNTGRAELPHNISGHTLSATVHGFNPSPLVRPADGPLVPGEEDEISMSLEVPHVAAGYRASFAPYPDYYDLFKLGAACSKPIDVYKEFDLRTPTASLNLSPSDEEPNAANLAWTVTNSKSAVVPVSISRNITKNGAGFFARNDAYNFGSRSQTDSASISSVNAGDVYCGAITISRTYGWRGGLSNGDIVDVVGPTSYDAGCSKVLNNPYLRVYGNDVRAGGDFIGGTCHTNGTIKAYNRFGSSYASTRSGSGVQLAAFANEDIVEFTSAMLRSAPLSTAKALSFANNAGSATYGGDFGGAFCITDFWGEMQYPDGSAEKTTLSGSASPASFTTQQGYRNGRLTLNGASNFSGKKAIFVNGDVRITGNIAYNGNYISGIPNFALVATGNIYIDKGVDQLDGLYVSQGGTIYTCGDNDFVAVSTSNLYSQCDQQLTINGAFVASKVQFLRTWKSLRDSSATDDSVTRANAAEVFNFSPEMYLSVPAFRPKGATTGGGYDYITTLPPIL